MSLYRGKAVVRHIRVDRDGLMRELESEKLPARLAVFRPAYPQSRDEPNPVDVAVLTGRPFTLPASAFERAWATHIGLTWSQPDLIPRRLNRPPVDISDVSWNAAESALSIFSSNELGALSGGMPGIFQGVFAEVTFNASRRALKAVFQFEYDASHGSHAIQRIEIAASLAEGERRPTLRSVDGEVAGPSVASRSNWLEGGDGADWLHGEGGDDYVLGGIGRDRLFGGRDGDRLFGGPGDDTAFGGADADALHGEDGDDRLAGDGGRDDLAGGPGDDALFGGQGVDALEGGQGHDRLEGGGGRDELDGGPGEDRLFGGAGGDQLSGDPGDDRVKGGPGADPRLYGGDGDDRVSGGRGADNLYGGAGDDRLAGGPGEDDLIDASGDNAAFGGGGDDHFHVRGGRMFAKGGPGDDRFTVAEAPLFGRFSTLNGGKGDDVFVLDGGYAHLRGGPGEDLFRFEMIFTSIRGGLRLLDFDPAEDDLRFAGPLRQRLTASEGETGLRLQGEDLAIVIDGLSLAEWDAL